MAGDVAVLLSILRISYARCRLMGLYPAEPKKHVKAHWEQLPGATDRRRARRRLQAWGCAKHGEFEDGSNSESPLNQSASYSPLVLGATACGQVLGRSGSPTCGSEPERRRIARSTSLGWTLRAEQIGTLAGSEALVGRRRASVENLRGREPMGLPAVGQRAEDS